MWSDIGSEGDPGGVGRGALLLWCSTRVVREVVAVMAVVATTLVTSIYYVSETADMMTISLS